MKNSSYYIHGCKIGNLFPKMTSRYRRRVIQGRNLQASHPTSKPVLGKSSRYDFPKATEQRVKGFMYPILSAINSERSLLSARAWLPKKLYRIVAKSTNREYISYKISKIDKSKIRFRLFKNVSGKWLLIAYFIT